VPALIEAITAYIEAHNQNPNSFQWTAKAEENHRESSPSPERTE